MGIGNQSNVNARVSQTINTKNQISGGFSWQDGDTTNPNLFGFIDAAPRDRHQHQFAVDASFHARI